MHLLYTLWFVVYVLWENPKPRRGNRKTTVIRVLWILIDIG